MSVSWPDSSTTMDYLGNSYSCLSSEQRSQFYEALLARCHSLEVLRQERIVLPHEALPSGIPTNPGIGIRRYVMSPRQQDSSHKRKAVVIACEFGIAESRRNEPIAICAVDCLTGDTLVSSLVATAQPMLDWRTNIHGIDLCHMDAAMKSGQCLPGWRAARDKLFQFIDEETILVGYGIRLPLELLRFYHAKIVDPQVLVTTAVFPKLIPLFGNVEYKSPLPRVCSEFLRLTLRQGLHLEVGIHDRLEDALAAREVALQCIKRPVEVEDWARRRRTEFWASNPRARTVCHDTSTSRQISASPVPISNTSTQKIVTQNALSQSSASDTSDEKYEAGYKAGFESGFRMGYDRGLDKANERQKHKSKTEKNDLAKIPFNSQTFTQELISFSDDGSESGILNAAASPRSRDGDDGDETSAAEIGGLFGQLMKDHKIRDMIQRVNLD